MPTETKDLRDGLRGLSAFWEVIAKDTGVDPKPIVDMLEEAVRELTPIDSSQQATLNRTRDVLVESPLAKVATIVVGQSEQVDVPALLVIDYGDIEPLDLTRVAGLMLRRVIKTLEAIIPGSEREEIQLRVIARQILEAIAKLPIDLGEEQKDGVQVARNAENLPL